jgi:hypothetical protein
MEWAPVFSSSHFAIVIVMWIDNEMRVIYSESIDKSLYTDILKHLNYLIAMYQVCKVFIDGSASHICHELKHQRGEYQRYEKLKPEILERFKYTECRSPLIVPVPFNKEGDNMMQMLHSCISKNILRIHSTME